MQQQLRRITDRMVQTGSQAAEQASRGLIEARKRGNEAARSAYGYAMNHPRTAAAVVLGTGVAAALIWMIRRNGGYAALRKQVLQRVRGTSTRSRKRVTNATAE